MKTKQKTPQVLQSSPLIASNFILLFEYFRKEDLCRDVPFPDVRLNSEARLWLLKMRGFNVVLVETLMCLTDSPST